MIKAQAHRTLSAVEKLLGRSASLAVLESGIWIKRSVVLGRTLFKLAHTWRFGLSPSGKTEARNSSCNPSMRDLSDPLRLLGLAAL